MKDNQFIQNNDNSYVWLLDLTKLQWSKKITTGMIPEQKIFSSIFAVNERIFLQGGILANGKYTSDIHVLDLKSFVWKRLFQMSMPKARVNPIVHVYDNKVFNFAGHDKKDVFPLNKIWFF